MRCVMTTLSGVQCQLENRHIGNHKNAARSIVTGETLLYEWGDAEMSAIARELADPTPQ
jgi:hypothetical protein